MVVSATARWDALGLGMFGAGFVLVSQPTLLCLLPRVPSLPSCSSFPCLPSLHCIPSCPCLSSSLHISVSLSLSSLPSLPSPPLASKLASCCAGGHRGRAEAAVPEQPCQRWPVDRIRCLGAWVPASKLPRRNRSLVGHVHHLRTVLHLAGPRPPLGYLPASSASLFFGPLTPTAFPFHLCSADSLCACCSGPWLRSLNKKRPAVPVSHIADLTTVRGD